MNDVWSRAVGFDDAVPAATTTTTTTTMMTVIPVMAVIMGVLVAFPLTYWGIKYTARAVEWAVWVSLRMAAALFLATAATAMIMYLTSSGTDLGNWSPWFSRHRHDDRLPTVKLDTGDDGAGVEVPQWSQAASKMAQKARKRGSFTHQIVDSVFGEWAGLFTGDGPPTVVGIVWGLAKSAASSGATWAINQVMWPDRKQEEPAKAKCGEACRLPRECPFGATCVCVDRFDQAVWHWKHLEATADQPCEEDGVCQCPE